MIQKIKDLNRRDERGFTLIELLVVIAIIAILAALILVALNAAQKGSRDSKRQSNVNQLKTAMANYYSANQSYPTASGNDTTTVTNICNALQTAGTISNCSLVTDPSGSVWYYNGSATDFNICVQSERDNSKAFGAGPTTTKSVASGAAACSNIG